MQYLTDYARSLPEMGRFTMDVQPQPGRAARKDAEFVEEYHKGQKTGVGVEQLQFTAAKRLEPAIALLSAVALTLLDLRDASRMPKHVLQSVSSAGTTWRC